MEEEIHAKFEITNLPYIVICLCGVILHLLLLNGLIRDPLKCFKNSKTFLVANLAVADFLVCLLHLSHRVMSWTGYELVVELPISLTMAVSVMTIASISIDRYFMVAYPIRHRNDMTGKVILLWLVCIWLLAAVYPAKLQIFGKQEHDHVVACISGVIITFIMVTACALTYFHLKKQTLNLRLQNCTSTENRAQEIRTLQEKRFLNTIIIIASIVVVCILPVSILDQVLTFEGVSKDTSPLAVKILLPVFNSMYYLNYSVNPLIYALRLPNYRKTFLKLYCKKAIRVES